MVVLRKRKKIKQLQQEVEELEGELESLKEENDRLEKKYESADKKRKKLARKKQNREEELNKLQNKLESLKDQTNEDEESETSEFEQVSFEEAYQTLLKLDTISSPEKDMISIYATKGLEDLEDLKGLKNTLNKEIYNTITKEKDYIAFTDTKALNYLVKTRNFYSPRWESGKSFNIEKILDFIEKEKYWVLVSSGNTRIFKEQEGSIELVKEFKDRIERQHSKGGLSQSRFERKREEQIKQHMKKVENYLKENLESKNVYILGNKNYDSHFKDYEYLGGFEESSKPLDSIYNFRIFNFKSF